MQCPECEIENEEGAYYCARCHKPLPQPPPPGACPHCGVTLDPAVRLTEHCPSCGDDPAKGAQIKTARRAIALAEVETQSIKLDAERARFSRSKGRRGCLPLTALALAVGVGAGGRAMKTPDVKASGCRCKAVSALRQRAPAAVPIVKQTMSAATGRRSTARRQLD
jgi:hypothetical protein